MVRKSVHMRPNTARRTRELVRTEIRNLELLDHFHIVKVLGCYEERLKGSRIELHMLMHPVGDEDLDTFLYYRYPDGSEDEKVQYRSWIGTWTKCLASALAYMHAQNIHHEDIKPANVVHCGVKIYYTDFSSSRRLNSNLETSTTSEAIATRMYAAPEAFHTETGISRHGSKTDVFSLGLVLVELLNVHNGKTMDELRLHLFGAPDNTGLYHTVVPQILSWFSEIETKSTTTSQPTHEVADVIYSDCFKLLRQMLSKTREARPSALEVLHTLSQDPKLEPISLCPCMLAQNPKWSTARASGEKSAGTAVEPEASGSTDTHVAGVDQSHLDHFKSETWSLNASGTHLDSTEDVPSSFSRESTPTRSLVQSAERRDASPSRPKAWDREKLQLLWDNRKSF